VVSAHYRARCRRLQVLGVPVQGRAASWAPPAGRRRSGWRSTSGAGC